jgi:(1->4)-alpha-D-glucan 1-alpha-D-glucosylmutase
VAKLWLVHRLLDLRRRRPTAFAADAAYEPIAVSGSASRCVAFSRGGEVAVAVAGIDPSTGDDEGETTITLPDGAWGGLDGREHTGAVPLSTLLDAFPVAVLERTR